MTLSPKAAFDVLTAAEWNELISSLLSVATVSNTDDTARTTTSATFTSTLTPANICGVAFTAPASGKVLIVFSVDQDNSLTGFCATSIEIAQGSSVGTGTLVLGAAFSVSKIDYNGQQSRAAVSHLHVGLTPGSAYNVYLKHQTSSGTGTFQWRSVVVVPQVL